MDKEKIVNDFNESTELQEKVRCILFIRRKIRHLSAEDVAKRCGLTKQTVRNIELGKHNYVPALMAVSEALDCHFYEVVLSLEEKGYFDKYIQDNAKRFITSAWKG